MHNPENSKLKKIFYDYSFIKEPMSIIRILDKMKVNPTESMKHIICRMQNNEDLDFIFNDVIKLIDTQNLDLKFYTNLYLKVYTKNNPIRQLLCVNTFLKDLSDKSDQIKKSTLKVIESIKDEVILSNFKNKIKNYKNESKEIKIRKLMIMNEIKEEDLIEFIKSEDLEMNYKGIEKMCIIKMEGGNGKGGYKKGGTFSDNLRNTLSNIVGDTLSNPLNSSHNTPHSNNSLRNTLSNSLSNPLNSSLSNPLNSSLSNTLSNFHNTPLSNPLNTPHNTPNLILDLINRNLNNPKSLYFLIKLAYHKNLNVSPFLNSNYLPLFFYSSLISNDKQSIYNSSLLFLKSSYEKVYHILLFQESLLDFVDYENSNYLIYEEDPFYIKTQKVKMLFYKLDDISIYELTRQSKGELREVILENGIKKGVVIEGILEDLNIDEGYKRDKDKEHKGLNDKGHKDKGYKDSLNNTTLYNNSPHSINSNIINILFNNFPFSLNYSYLIKNYLLNINPFTLNQDSFIKYLYLVGKVCDDYEIIDLDLIKDSSLINPILKFYISFFKRKILSEEKFIEIIRRLKKNEKFKEKAKVLLNLINLKGPYVLFDFEDQWDDKRGNEKGVKLEIYEENDCDDVFKDIKGDDNRVIKDNGDIKDNRINGDIIDNRVNKGEVNDGDDNRVNGYIDNPILTCKPYYQNNPIPNFNNTNLLPSLKESLNNNFFNNPFNFKGEDWSFNDNLLYSSSGDLIIDTFLLKGTLSLTKEDIKLEIDILEKSLKIKFGIEELKNEILIEKEEIIILHKIEFKDIDKKFKIKIEYESNDQNNGDNQSNGDGQSNNQNNDQSKEDDQSIKEHDLNPIIKNMNNFFYEILIEKEKLIIPFDCTKSLFENEFKRIKNYKIIEKLDEKLVKKIDLNSFAFKILGKIVYGKNFCDQVVIKGEKEVMEIF